MNYFFCCWLPFYILKGEKNFCRSTGIFYLTQISRFILLEWEQSSEEIPTSFKRAYRIWKNGRKQVLMVARNSFSIYFRYIKKYCNTHVKFLFSLQFFYETPKSLKLPSGRKHTTSLSCLPVFCLNLAVPSLSGKSFHCQLAIYMTLAKKAI